MCLFFSKIYLYELVFQKSHEQIGSEVQASPSSGMKY